MTQQTAAGPAAARVAVEPLVGLDRGWGVWPLAALRSAGLPFGLLDRWAAGTELALPPGERRRQALRRHGDDVLDHFVRDPRFRAALTWQNPAVVDNWIGRWAAESQAGRRPVLGRMDRRDSLVARYAQRYCAKNDTIGFFGPVAWARLGAATTAIRGGAAIRHSRVHVETWVGAMLARAWESHPEVAGHLPARLDPACVHAEGRVFRPRRPPLPLTAAERAVVAALAEGGSVDEVLTRSGLHRAEAAIALDRLRRARVAQVGFRLPAGVPPIPRLRHYLNRLPATARTAAMRGQLDALESARARAELAAGATGSPEAVRAALADADGHLAAATGGPVPRPPGRDLGGRVPLYLDCRRDLDVDLADGHLDGLRGPLAVLLDSGRWLTTQLAGIVAIKLLERYHALARRGPVTLADLQFAGADVLTPTAAPFAGLLTDFQLRWSEIIGAGSGPMRVPAQRARRLADSLFPAGREGAGRSWAAARVHSPDLMPRLMADGSLRWVLGELHLALNTLESRVFLDQADDAEALRAGVAATMPGGRVVPVYPADGPDVTSRTYPPPALDPDRGYRYWSYASDDGHWTGSASTPATGLIVTCTNNELVATSAADGWAAPVLECFGEFLSAQAVNLFKLRPPTAHAPRVDVGELTVCRESWRVRVADLGPVQRRTTDPGHDRLRAWAAGHGLPRRTFVRLPDSPKPFFVDFAAPALVDGLAQAVRRTAPDGYVELVEMLPGPDELWLTLDGERFTAELRVVAVDPVPPRRAWWSVPTGAGG